jgi:hypothetical protein
MTKKNNSFNVNKVCAQKGCKVAVQDGAKYCSQHITIDGDAAVAASTANTTKEENTMNNTQSKGDSLKEKATATTNKVKAFFTKKDKPATTDKSFKETASTAWAAIKRASMKALRYINDNRTLVAIGSTAISVAGLFTGCLTGALLVGGGIATLTVLAMHLIAKKKEQKLNYKALLNNLATANGTVLAMPFVLLGLSYVLAFAFVYGAALPYAIIVA